MTSSKEVYDSRSSCELVVRCGPGALIARGRPGTQKSNTSRAKYRTMLDSSHSETTSPRRRVPGSPALRHDENGVLLTDQQVYDSLPYRMQGYVCSCGLGTISSSATASRFNVTKRVLARVASGEPRSASPIPAG